MAERVTGLYRLTQLSSVYSLLQNAIGGERGTRTIADDYINPRMPRRILDFGCGPANILRFVDCDEYVGIDRNERHIAAARKAHGNRGTFLTGDFKTVVEEIDGPFDMVLALGFLHHLEDAQAAAVCRIAHRALQPEGTLLTVDPAFVKAQHRIAKWLARLDSGQNVRAPDGYEAILSPLFADIETSVRHDLLAIPYTHCIVAARR